MSIPPPQSFELSHSSATYTSADNGTDAERPPSPVANRFEDHSHNVIQALPPVDGGRDAWLFLAAAFMIETLVWGLPFSVGILHQYWSTIKFPQSQWGAESSQLLTLAATLQTGLMYCSVIIYGPILQNFPRHRAKMQVFGLLSSVIGIIGSAFATQPWHLVLAIGIIYPLGGTVFYMPAPTLSFQWFNSKRGLASAVVYAGTGIGGATFPFVMEALINALGYRTALISIAIGYGILGILALTFIKPRLPVVSRPEDGTRYGRPMNSAFLRRSSFYAFGGAILFTSFGNFVPFIYLPAYAADLGLTAGKGTLLVAVMNAVSVPGILVLVHLSDRAPLRFVILLSCVSSALACLLLWGFSTRLSVLVVFAVVFGLLGLSFSGVWAALITTVAKDDPYLLTNVFTLFTFARDIGNIASGPISNSLLSHNLLQSGYGVENYGSLLLYTGLMMVLGSGVGMAYNNDDS